MEAFNMDTIKTAFGLAKDLLVEGYEIVVNLIEANPRIVFWLAVSAIALAWAI